MAEGWPGNESTLVSQATPFACREEGFGAIESLARNAIIVQHR